MIKYKTVHNAIFINLLFLYSSRRAMRYVAGNINHSELC